MAKVDLSKLGLNGKKEDDGEQDVDPLRMQQMRLEEAKWRAMSGAGLGGGEADPIDAEIAKNLRQKRVREMLRDTGEDNGSSNADKTRIRELEKEIQGLHDQIQEEKRRKEQAEQDAKWEKRISSLESLIQTKATQDSATMTKSDLRIMDELEAIKKDRENEREERKKEKEEAEKKLTEDKITALGEDMSDRMNNLETLLIKSQGQKTPGIVEQARQIVEERQAAKTIAEAYGYSYPGKGEDNEEKWTIDGIIDSVATNSDKLMKTGRSIYNLAKGSKESDANLIPDIGPRESVHNFEPKGKLTEKETPSWAPKGYASLEDYIAKGKNITNHPNFPGQNVFVGAYGDYYINDDGTPLDKDAAILSTKTDRAQMETNVRQAETQFNQWEKEEKNNAPPAPPEPKKKNETPPESKEQPEPEEPEEPEPEVEGDTDGKEENKSAEDDQ